MNIPAIDTVITSTLYSALPHNLLFNLVFSFFSLYGYSILIWIVPLIILFIKEEIEDKRFIIIFILVFAVTIVLNDFVFKNIFQRPRPVQFNSMQCPINYSFPSTHAATAFASAVVLSYFDKKRKYFYYFIAFLIAFSRIYLGCHYFLDVIFGSIIGYIVSIIILEKRKFKKTS